LAESGHASARERPLTGAKDVNAISNEVALTTRFRRSVSWTQLIQSSVSGTNTVVQDGQVAEIFLKGRDGEELTDVERLRCERLRENMF